MTFIPIDGPSLYGALSVTTTPQEVKIGAGRLSERKGVAIQPMSNFLYLGFDNSVSSTNGIELQRKQIFMFEAGESMEVWAVASSGTIDVRVWELG